MSAPPPVTPVDRPELGLALELKRHNRLRMVTPYWHVGAFAVQSTVGRWLWRKAVPLSKFRQAPVSVGAATLVGLPPLVVFTVWMTQRADEFASSDLEWRLWLGGTWIVLYPALVTDWERRFINLHGSINETAPEDGWRLDQLVHVDRIFARLWWAFIASTGLAVAVGFIADLDFFRENTGTGDLDFYFWSGLTIVTILGISFGAGSWGIVKTLAYARAVLDQPFTWNPFLARHNPRIESLMSFCYCAGFVYSMGSVLLPGAYDITRQLSPFPKAIGVLVTLSLIFGGAAAFIIPSIWMHQITQRQRYDAMQRYADVLRELESQALTEGCSTDHAALSSRVGTVTALRSVVAGERASPSALWVGGRVFILFLLPLLISLTQTVTNLR